MPMHCVFKSSLFFKLVFIYNENICFFFVFPKECHPVDI
uniref:Uncharacterized protein n=1 Tax=Anguilla anguilla TaxID=7936 RepID=A0A0E9QHR3_ANGAN